MVNNPIPQIKNKVIDNTYIIYDRFQLNLFVFVGVYIPRIRINLIVCFST